MTRSESETWRAYYAATGARAPRATLLIALDRFAAEGADAGKLHALDLGCGSGRDAVELLARGWSVLAIDAEPAAIEALRARPEITASARSRLETRVARFEAARWPRVDLVNASFALPLVPPAAFAGLWRRIVASLKPGGRFAGQLYGERDGWAGDPTITFFSRSQVEALLAGLEVEHLLEEEDDSVTPRGAPKHWHIFHVVARKPHDRAKEGSTTDSTKDTAAG
ncbi:MAG TPA: class I SAM-dependent methyltransferase [Alphaproteobacteria bacterium]